MTLEELIGLVRTCPERVAEFLVGQEKELIDFLVARNKEARISYLEKQLADVPKLQAELDILKPKEG